MADDRDTDARASGSASSDPGADWGAMAAAIRQAWRTITGAVVIGAALGAAGSYLVTPEFTSTATFIPPRQQGGVAAGLASLGSLAGLAGGAIGLKSPADEYVSLMQSVTVSDRIIDRFGLMKAYEMKYRSDARKKLADQVRITPGKKDGLISVEVEDADPARAAQMANQFVEELRRVTSTLAVSEAQQRRVFFAKQMQETQANLVAAQTALQRSGVGASAIKAEPKAAADQYAALRAQATAAEVKLQALRSTLADASPEVQQLQAQHAALEEQLERLAANVRNEGTDDADYTSRYRAYKYQETLFELMSRQYELARIDEAREGDLIQVVDVAQPAELKSKPRRTLMAVAGALACGLLMAVRALARQRAAL